jgi:3D (Asp-Asp-Asp) domain-containing protein
MLLCLNILVVDALITPSIQGLTISSALHSTIIAPAHPYTIEIFIATAYTCDGLVTEAQKLMNCPNGITASGTIPDEKTLACDRKYLGRSVLFPDTGEIKTCLDTGGAIKDKRIDIYKNGWLSAINYGKKEVKVAIL